MLYVGVTSDLAGRVFTHKNDLAAGFQQKIPHTQPCLF